MLSFGNNSASFSPKFIKKEDALYIKQEENVYIMKNDTTSEHNKYKKKYSRIKRVIKDIVVVSTVPPSFLVILAVA